MESLVKITKIWQLNDCKIAWFKRVMWGLEDREQDRQSKIGIFVRLAWTLLGDTLHNHTWNLVFSPPCKPLFQDWGLFRGIWISMRQLCDPGFLDLMTPSSQMKDFSVLRAEKGDCRDLALAQHHIEQLWRDQDTLVPKPSNREAVPSLDSAPSPHRILWP